MNASICKCSLSFLQSIKCNNIRYPHVLYVWSVLSLILKSLGLLGMGGEGVNGQAALLPPPRPPPPFPTLSQGLDPALSEHHKLTSPLKLTRWRNSVWRKCLSRTYYLITLYSLFYYWILCWKLSYPIMKVHITFCIHQKCDTFTITIPGSLMKSCVSILRKKKKENT